MPVDGSTILNKVTCLGLSRLKQELHRAHLWAHFREQQRIDGYD